MRRARSAFVVVAMAAAAAAQGGRFGRGGRGDPLANNPNAGLIQDLYRAARQAIGNLPTLLQPRQLTDLASDEMRIAHDQALNDYQQAFQSAVSLPAGDATALGQARARVKSDIETRAVSELARNREYDGALALARAADVPKGPLYDVLIETAESGGRGGRFGQTSNVTATDPRPTVADVLSLIQECKRADGTYPYRGVATLLRGRGSADAGLDRIMLVRDGYQWAGNETDPGRIQDAVFFLQAGHRAEPELDNMLAATVTTQLTRLARETTDASAGAQVHADAMRLMALLQEVDATQAQAMAAAFPELEQAGEQESGATAVVTDAAGAATLQFNGNGGGRGRGSGSFTLMSDVGGVQSLQVQVLPDAATSSGADAATASGSQSFLMLLAQAEAEQRHDPGQALGLANQAEALLDDSVLAAETGAATRLAALYAQLQDTPDSQRVLARCLDEADRLGTEADADFAAADDTSLAQWAAGEIPNQGAVIAAYSMAARLDFAATAARVEAAPFVELKPMVLTRVALVGEVARRPAPE